MSAPLRVVAVVGTTERIEVAVSDVIPVAHLLATARAQPAAGS